MLKTSEAPTIVAIIPGQAEAEDQLPANALAEVDQLPNVTEPMHDANEQQRFGQRIEQHHDGNHHGREANAGERADGVGHDDDQEDENDFHCDHVPSDLALQQPSDVSARQ